MPKVMNKIPFLIAKQTDVQFGLNTHDGKNSGKKELGKKDANKQKDILMPVLLHYYFSLS